MAEGLSISGCMAILVLHIRRGRWSGCIYKPQLLLATQFRSLARRDAELERTSADVAALETEMREAVRSILLSACLEVATKHLFTFAWPALQIAQDR